jgi:hypothetical protein
MAATVAFFTALQRNTTKQEEEEGNDVVVVTFFAAQQRSTAPQEEEEGDDSSRRLLRCITNRTRKEEKIKDAYLGPAWVPLELQPQLPSSSSRHASAPAIAPALSSLSFDSSRALAME